MTLHHPNVIVMDTETTGLDCKEDRLVEIAGVRLEDSKSFEAVVNPERSIPPEARAIHHISPEEAALGISESAAVSQMNQQLLNLSARRIYVAHNAKFDRGFIERIAPVLDLEWICTYKCSVVTWAVAPAHGNQVLRYYLGLDLAGKLPPGLFPHRALYDCIVTRELLIELLKHHTLDQLVKISNNPVLLAKVSFGKHKGKLWSEVDYGYLRWCSSQSDMNEDVLHTAAHYMRRR